MDQVGRYRKMEGGGRYWEVDGGGRYGEMGGLFPNRFIRERE